MKCMPLAFSYGKNFSVSFCQTESEEVCPHEIVKELMKLIKPGINFTEQRFDEKQLQAILYTFEIFWNCFVFAFFPNIENYFSISYTNRFQYL